MIEGHSKVAQLLLASGARIDAPSPEGTALQLASEVDSGELVGILLASGAHTTSPRHFGSSVLRRLGLKRERQ